MGIVLLFNTVTFLYYIRFSIVNGYLPAPFLYDKSDTFMDLFNTLHWAYDDGRYTDWGSVYPPLNFLILKLLNVVFIGKEYDAPEFMRENSPLVIVGFCLIYLLAPAILLKTRLWHDFKKSEKLIIYFSLVLSAPMLFALERGNMIVITPVLLAFALSTIGIKRYIFIAILINIKAYFAILLIYYIARKNWKEFTICSGLSGFVFLISGLALDKHVFVFFINLLNFSRENGIFSLREMMAMPSSISAFSYVLKNPAAVTLASGHLNTAIIAIIISMIEIVKWSLLAISLTTLFVRSSVMRDAEMFTLLVVVISNLGVWVGGYTIILYIALIPVFIQMHARWLYISLLALMAMPFDIIPLMAEPIGVQYSYLSDAYISINWTLGFGSVIRPVLNILLLLTLVCEFLTRKLYRPTAMSG